LLLRKDLNKIDRFDDIKKMLLKEWKRDSKDEEKIDKK